MSDRQEPQTEQQTLSGRQKPLGKACSHYGRGYEKGCDNDAEWYISAKFGAVEMEMHVCEECLKTVAENADEVFEQRTLHDRELIA